MFIRFILVVAILASSLLARAQEAPPAPPAQSAAQPQAKQPEPCTISGRVLTAADGAPLKSAHVMLVQENAKDRPVIFGESTDQDGRFEIKKVPPGRYRFTASKAGFVRQEYQAKGTGPGAILSLVPGQELTDVSFRLTRAAVIAGRVVDESGEPMVRVYVSVLRRPTPDEREMMGPQAKTHQFVPGEGASTDDRGEYRIFGLKPGEYFIKAAAQPDPGRMNYSGESDPSVYFYLRNAGTEDYAPIYYPGVLQISDAQPIPLRAGEEMQADFALRKVKTVFVAGHIIGADGKPATHAFVMLSVPSGDEGWGSELQAMTDSKGEFLIKGVPPGGYVLNAQQHDENKHEMARQKIEVGESNIESLVVSFGRGTTIRGRIVTEGSSAALDRIGLNLESQAEEDSMPGGWAQVKADGSFQFTDVQDGSYVVDVFGLEKGWFVKAIHFGATDVLQKGLQLESGSGAGNLEVLISSAAAQLDGAVIDDDGKPVVAAQVSVQPDPETPFNRHRGHRIGTDQNGRFSFASLAPGKYKVSARRPSASEEAPAVTSEPQTITLNERDHQSLQIELKPPDEQR